MTTGTRSRRRVMSRQYRSSPYPVPSCKCEALTEEMHAKKKCSKALGRKDWEDATCSVCLEYPHNAVLLLCSSHDKGCRPYMCGTSYRYSNCLDQFEKAYTKAVSPRHEQPWSASGDYSNVGSGSGLSSGWSAEKCEAMELACPLCRGQVKGWTVVEAAREHLNAKKRACMQDNCSFVGTYKELRKHVKREHPAARPREVDPVLEQKWRRLEHERERDDVISTIRSSMPGAMVLGDYVIERNPHNFDTDDDEGAEEDDGGYEVDFDDSNVLNVLLLLQAFGQGGNGRINTRLRRLERGFHHSLNEGVRGGVVPTRAAGHDATISEGDDDTDSTASHHQARVMGLGRSVRRRRRRSQR